MMIQMLMGAGSSAEGLFVVNNLTTVTVYAAGSYSQVVSANANASYLDNGQIVNYYNSIVNNWGLPTTPGAGVAFWLRATFVSGEIPFGSALGTWHQLSSTRSWAIVRILPGTSTSTLTVQIASDSAGSNILNTHTLTLIAQVE